MFGYVRPSDQRLTEEERRRSVPPTAACATRWAAGAARRVEQPVKRRVAEQLLYHLGRWIYLVDAADDLADDLRSGSYNPLALRFPQENGALTPEGLAACWPATLDGSVRAMAAAFELAGPRRIYACDPGHGV